MNDPVSLFILRSGDLLFGWMLRLPGDLPLLVLAVLTALILVVIRRWTTNQDRLGRISDDLARLKQATSRAKADGDRAECQRLVGLKARIGLMRLRDEGKTLLWALIPIALLAAWAYERMPYHAPRTDETVALRLVMPVSSVGRLAHAVADEGLTLQRAVAVFEPDSINPRESIATWVVQMNSEASQSVTVVSPAGRFSHPIVAGSGPPPSVIAHDTPSAARTELVLRERRLFGLLPGVPSIALPAWLVGYLIIVIALIPITKRIVRLR